MKGHWTHWKAYMDENALNEILSNLDNNVMLEMFQVALELCNVQYY